MQGHSKMTCICMEILRLGSARLIAASANTTATDSAAATTAKALSSRVEDTFGARIERYIFGL